VTLAGSVRPGGSRSTQSPGVTDSYAPNVPYYLLYAGQGQLKTRPHFQSGPHTRMAKTRFWLPDDPREGWLGLSSGSEWCSDDGERNAKPNAPYDGSHLNLKAAHVRSVSPRAAERAQPIGAGAPTNRTAP
jgi:hypothetical protein